MNFNDYDEMLKILDLPKKEFLYLLMYEIEESNIENCLRKYYEKNKTPYTIDELKLILKKINNQYFADSLYQFIMGDIDEKVVIELLLDDCYNISDELLFDSISKFSKENILNIINRNDINISLKLQLLLKSDFINEIDSIYKILNDENIDYEMLKIIINIYKENNGIMYELNLDILRDNRYLKLKDKLETFLNYRDIQEKLLKLDDIRYTLLLNCLSLMDKQGYRWQEIIDKISTNLLNDDYSKLINSFINKDLSDEDIGKIILLFSNDANYFNIDSYEKFDNYFEIRNRVCDDIMNDQYDEAYPWINQMSSNDRKRFAVMMLLYGVGLNEVKDEYSNIDLYEGYTIKGVNHFNDIDYMKKRNNKLFTVVETIQKLLKINNTKLETIYSNIKLDNRNYVTMYAINYLCRLEYAKLYNESLYKINNKDKLDTSDNNELYSYEEDGKLYKLDVHELNDCDNLLVTSLGAINNQSDYLYEQNYSLGWNRNDKRSQFFCGTMLGKEKDYMPLRIENNIGFSDIPIHNLLKVSIDDSMTSDGRNLSFYGGRSPQFKEPKKLVSFGGVTTEVNIDRSVNGKRMQPSYVVFYKWDKNGCFTKKLEDSFDYRIGTFYNDNGLVNNDNYYFINAKKMAYQFNVPLLIVDLDKMLLKKNSDMIRMNLTFGTNYSIFDDMRSIELIRNDVYNEW